MIDKANVNAFSNGKDMKELSIGACLIIFIVFLSGSLFASAQNDLQRQTLIHQNIERTYHVHYPKNRLPTEPKPLQFVLHGGGGADAQTMAKRTKMNTIADREWFLKTRQTGDLVRSGCLRVRADELPLRPSSGDCARELQPLYAGPPYDRGPVLLIEAQPDRSCFLGPVTGVLVAEGDHLPEPTRHIHRNRIKTAKGREGKAEETLSHLRKYPWNNYPSWMASRSN